MKRITKKHSQKRHKVRTPMNLKVFLVGVQSDLHKAMVDKIKSFLCRYVLGPPIGFIEKKLETIAQKRISSEIDQELRKNNQPLNTVLLFGAEQSGKSTIIKQMRILYGSNFDEEEKKEIVNNIKQNIKDAILNILTAMSKLTPSMPLEMTENQVRLDDIQNYASKPGLEYTMEFFHHTEVLWKDKCVQTAFERGNEYRLTDCAKYFLDRISIILHKKISCIVTPYMTRQ